MVALGDIERAVPLSGAQAFLLFDTEKDNDVAEPVITLELAAERKLLLGARACMRPIC